MVAPTRSALQVLVVAKSPVNRVVISGIVERAGLKAISETAAVACGRLAGMAPDLAIVDSDNECEQILTALRDYRRGSSGSRPRVILLSSTTAPATPLNGAAVVDAVVVKPLTTETLQPVIDRLLASRPG